jgi:hypothetical protein
MEKIKERADAYMQQVYMANPKKNRARKRKSNQINWEQKKIPTFVCRNSEVQSKRQLRRGWI